MQETEHFDMSMEELASLAKTAGAEVVASYTQKRERYDSKSFVGSGKLEEIKAMVDTGHKACPNEKIRLMWIGRGSGLIWLLSVF